MLHQAPQSNTTASESDHTPIDIVLYVDITIPFTHLVLGRGGVPLLQTVQVDVSRVTLALTGRHLRQKGRKYFILNASPTTLTQMYQK